MGYASVGLLATEGLKWILIAFHGFPSWASLTWAVLNCPGFFGGVIGGLGEVLGSLVGHLGNSKWSYRAKSLFISLRE